MSAPTIGKYAEMVRNDGREFVGVVQDVRHVEGKGTLVILDTGKRFASVYVEDCKTVNDTIDPVFGRIAMYGFENIDTGYKG